VGNFPTLDREEAEALTEEIRRRLDEGDEACVKALKAGVPPAMLAAEILQAWNTLFDEVNDAEFTDPVWRHIVAPRIEAILDGQPPAGGGS
jgi:hypothetical protein